MSYSLHRLAPDEWRRYSVIRLRALRSNPEAFFSVAADAQGFTETEWRRRLNPPSATWVIRQENGNDVGLVSTLPYLEEDAQPLDWQLVSMWLAEEARGSGAADLLVGAACEHAATLGANRMVLWVADGNQAAERLYARHGFNRTGLTGSFPPPRETGEYQMALLFDA